MNRYWVPGKGRTNVYQILGSEKGFHLNLGTYYQPCFDTRTGLLT